MSQVNTAVNFLSAVQLSDALCFLATGDGVMMLVGESTILVQTKISEQLFD